MVAYAGTKRICKGSLAVGCAGRRQCWPVGWVLLAWCVLPVMVDEIPIGMWLFGFDTNKLLGWLGVVGCVVGVVG